MSYFCGDVNPTLKKKSLAKLLESKEKFDLCDIWRLRIAKTKRYTFKQHHNIGLFSKRLTIFLLQTDFNFQLRTNSF